jgi:hypothetical protein
MEFELKDWKPKMAKVYAAKFKNKDCEVCNKKKRIMDIQFMKELKNYQERFSSQNLILLCKKCTLQFHGKDLYIGMLKLKHQQTI